MTAFRREAGAPADWLLTFSPLKFVVRRAFEQEAHDLCRLGRVTELYIKAQMGVQVKPVRQSKFICNFNCCLIIAQVMNRH